MRSETRLKGVLLRAALGAALAMEVGVVRGQAGDAPPALPAEVLPEGPPQPEAAAMGAPAEAPVPGNEPGPVTNPRPRGEGWGGPGGGFLDGLNLTGGPIRPRASYAVSGAPAAGVVGQATDLAWLRQELFAVTPVWQDGTDQVGVTLLARSLLTDTAAVFPDSGRPYPDTPWDARLGLLYGHRFAGGTFGTANVSFGSASDRPFARGDVLTVNANGLLVIPAAEGRDAWLLSVTYSPNREPSFPIPGLAYLWQPNDRLRMALGLPFFVGWRPVEDVSLDLFYLPVRVVRARASWRVVGPARLYAGFDWTNEVYYLDDPGGQSPFALYEKRASGGVMCPLSEKLFVEVAGGWLFDRFSFTGRRYEDREQNRVDVEDGPFVLLRLGMRF